LRNIIKKLYNKKIMQQNLESSFFLGLKCVIAIGVILILFSPLIFPFSGGFFFPFVGFKSLWFMGFTEIIFFLWLILILFSKKERPQINLLFIAILLFVLFLILSAIFGVDPSRSFWSKFERMTGILMWFHLLAFFIVIASVFKKSKEQENVFNWDSVFNWNNVFFVSLIAGAIVSLTSFLKQEQFRGGGMLGNDSFLGTYLLFNLFIAIYLFFKAQINLKISSIIPFAIMLFALFNSGARAAKICFIAGSLLIFFFWLIFYNKRIFVEFGGGISAKFLRNIGIFLLTISVISFFLVVYFAFQPGNIVYNQFTQMASKSRLLVWEIGWHAFLQKPVLGWGSENFELAFMKNFDPKIYLQEYGGEIWFDRAHNIIIDRLVENGIIGLVSYLFIFLAAIIILFRHYLKTKDFYPFIIFVPLFAAYFVQNLTVFDMVSSYMMFFLILGFISVLDNKEKATEFTTLTPTKLVLAILFIFSFFASFHYFFYQPLKADADTIKAISVDPRLSNASQIRLSFYKKTLEDSPMGKYQIRDYFCEAFINYFYGQKKSNTLGLTIEEKKELEFLIGEAEKTRKVSPFDLRAYLSLSRLYDIYGFFDKENFKKAEEILQEALLISPRHQEVYLMLAQIKIHEGNNNEGIKLLEEAVALEPRLEQSHFILLNVIKAVKNEKLFEEKIKEALKINPWWRKDFEKAFSTN